MQSIIDIGKALSHELRLDRLLQLIMKEVTRLIGAERSTFYLVDEEYGELWSKIALKAEIKEIRLKIGVGIAGHVAKTGEIINIKDAYADSRFDPTTDKKTGYRTRSILCMPIFEPRKKTVKKAKIIGVLQVLNKIDGVFTKEDEDLLAGLAAQVAISVINSRFYSALEKKVAELNLMFEVERDLNKAYSLDELINNLVQKIAAALPVEAALLAVNDTKTDNLYIQTTSNISRELIASEIKSGNGFFDQVYKTGQIVVSNNVPGEGIDAGQSESRFGIEVRQLICAPVVIAGQVRGLLAVINRKHKDDYFHNDDVQLLTSLASQIARTIEAYQLREEKMKADRLASIGNMMSAIVHDLRTPMNNIYGFVDLMQEESDAELRQEFAEIVRNQIKILTNMTRDVLDFAKGKTSVLPVKYPVDKLLSEFQKLFENDVRKQGYKLQTECNTQSMIYIDPEKVTRIFMNIMRNGLEAMAKGGTFTISASQVDSEIEFALSDTGTGIPDEIKNRLFDSFVTKGKKSGTGLGLAIVKKLIDEHKGRIEVDSEKGRGTTFRIYFKKL